VPVIHVDIDRSKANELGISMRSINDTLALLVGEHYVNRFNRVGRSFSRCR
jgi:multidrug efflux pump